MIRVVLTLLAVCLLPLSAGAVSLRDGLGRTVDLPRKPLRIVSLTPSVTEMLFALGLGDRVVGVTDNDDWPPQARRRAHVGDIHPDFERILALKPDLVVMEGSLAPSTLTRLETLHLPVLALDSGTLAGFRRSVLLVATATGTTPRAQALLSDLDRHLAAVGQRARKRPAGRWPTVFVEVGEQPLFAAGPGTFVNELVQLAGGVNVFADGQTAYPQVSAEWLLARNPDVIVLTTSSVEAFSNRPGFDRLKAVRSGRIYRIDPPDPIVRPSFRLAQGVEALARCFQTPP